jgi:hypothetical protein
MKSKTTQLIDIKMKTKTTQLIDIKEIAQQIKSGEYPREEIDITQFFTKLNDDEYAPNRDSSLQVRDVDRDRDFIERIVNKIKQSGDFSGLKDLTCVYFPEDNTTKLLNGHHTAEIEVNLKIYKANACIVNFETQLDGKMSNVARLGNLLNTQDFETVAVKRNDVKKEFEQMMNERESEGLDPKPTEDEITEFIELYPFISRATFGQWLSYHPTIGGRVKPMHTYSDGELAVQRRSFNNQLDYINHTVLDPRTLDSWDQTGVAEIFKQCMEEDKRKALVIFYCSTVKQVDKLKTTNIKEKIKSFYDDLACYWGLEIKAVFLRYE